jgi:hypothetical protein
LPLWLTAYFFVFFRIVPLWEKVFNYQIILVGTIAGVAATVGAISTLVSPDTFILPCYVHVGSSEV